MCRYADVFILVVVAAIAFSAQHCIKIIMPPEAQFLRLRMQPPTTPIDFRFKGKFASVGHSSASITQNSQPWS